MSEIQDIYRQNQAIANSRISDSFPPIGQERKAHLGSQSSTPSKEADPNEHQTDPWNKSFGDKVQFNAAGFGSQ